MSKLPRGVSGVSIKTNLTAKIFASFFIKSLMLGYAVAHFESQACQRIVDEEIRT